MSATSNSVRLRDSRFTLIFIFVLGLTALCTVPAKAQDKSEKALSASAKAAASDPVLAAMREELERSKAHLKMENIAAPYYIEYSVLDLDEYDAEAAFGALRQKQRSHGRSARVVVRVGDYKLDSYYGPGTGFVDLAPLDDDATALRHQLWLATDQAYKAASQALAAKEGRLQPVQFRPAIRRFCRRSRPSIHWRLGETRFQSRSLGRDARESDRSFPHRS